MKMFLISTNTLPAEGEIMILKTVERDLKKTEREKKEDSKE